MRLIVLAFLVVVTGSGPASGSNTPPPPIATDRAAVTASSVVVPPGSVQAENGFAETASQGQHTVDGPESLLRLGVASKTELRLTVPDYFGQVEGSPRSSGFGDVEIAMKQQLGPARGFDVSLIVSLSLPTGAAAISSHGYDPSVQLPWSRALSRNWTAARKRPFGKRYFGEVCLWSSDSRYLALSEWRSFAEAHGPDTPVAVIDVPGQHWCALDRMCGGFAEPMQFEGSSLICTKTAFDKERRAHVETCAVDLAARHDWRSVVLGQP